MKVGFVGCWCHMRIYSVQAAHLREPLEKLVGEDIPVFTSNCNCFYEGLPSILKSFSTYKELLTTQDVAFYKLPHLRLKKDSKFGYFSRRAVRGLTERRRGRHYAKMLRDKSIAHFHQSADAFGYDSLKWFLKFAKNKTVVTIYRLSPQQEEDQGLNRVYNKADAVIVSTDYMKRNLVNCGVIAEKLHVIPYGATAKPIARSQRDGAIMFAGSPLVNVKGFEYLAPALRMLKDEGKPIRLKLHGYYMPGEREWALDIIKKEGIEDLIDWLSFRSYDDLADAYQKSICCAIPYTDYTPCFPITVAMANALPVVASDAMGIPEYLGEGGGIMVPQKSVETLAAALRKVRDNEALRNSLGQQGRAIAERRFAWDVLAKQTYEVYQQVLNSKK
jgi:glycosyltransferase involved in cell wall biosynthesis